MSEEFTLDWPHGHQTRNGNPVRIICTNAYNNRPIVALVTTKDDGKEHLYDYTEDGHFRSWKNEEDTGLDLINKPAPMTISWVNVYDNVDGWVLHRSLRMAQKSASEGRLACRAITFLDGRIVDVTDEQEVAR